uniref:Uncharacterized protein n=1 Tax=Pipistrellus kuhlii TaxID=59472 RepID=A0A7J7VN24_PIPKU|nr:hypothetical protein mPipKuh1_008359 [Pipistrellus kuhlii]
MTEQVPPLSPRGDDADGGGRIPRRQEPLRTGTWDPVELEVVWWCQGVPCDSAGGEGGGPGPGPALGGSRGARGRPCCAAGSEGAPALSPVPLGPSERRVAPYQLPALEDRLTAGGGGGVFRGVTWLLVWSQLPRQRAPQLRMPHPRVTNT